MKKTVILTFFCLLAIIPAYSQPDTLYMFKDGSLIIKRAVADIDSIIFYKAEAQPVDSIADVDGNVYNTITIGGQEWMAENLRVTKYANGNPIPRNLTGAQWSVATDGAYAVYPDSVADGIDSYEEMLAAYGALYNFYAVIDPRGICPTGWRVPKYEDIVQLQAYINGTVSPNGNKLKSCLQENSIWDNDCASSSHPRWSAHHAHYGTDDYGFSGLPSGYRITIVSGATPGEFRNIGNRARWWSSTIDMSLNNRAYTWGLDYDLGILVIGSNWALGGGLSVRCIKDN